MVMRGAARPVQHERLHLTVTDDLEGRILSGEIAVGDRLLSESEIARDYSVSSRSVREAMQVLETKGLIQRRLGERALLVRRDVDEFLGTLATTVRQLFATDPDYLVQLMDVRRMIEVEVMDILCSRTGDLRPEVPAALKDLHDAAEAQDFTRFTACDAAFHLALVRSTGNAILSVLYDNLYGLITEVIRVTSGVPVKSLGAALAEHANIHALIEARDTTGARDAMRTHIENSSGYLHVAILNATNEGQAE